MGEKPGLKSEKIAKGVERISKGGREKKYLSGKRVCYLFSCK